MSEPIIIDPAGHPFGVVGCEECGNETVCTGPDQPENCPHCGAYLWEDDIPDDTPDSIRRFTEDI